MNTYNGVLMPNSVKPFKLNWASGGGLIDRKEDRQPEYSIFVGDLSSEITEYDLLSIFQSRYMSCKSAKIMTDPRTGMTRGYGFVRFADALDQQRALLEMQGYFIGSRAIRVSVATPKSKNQQQQLIQLQQQQIQLLQQLQQQQQRLSSSSTASSSLLTSPNKSPLLTNNNNDIHNTTVFVGGLSTPISEDELRQYFQHFGEIVYVKIPPGKGCGFVQYVTRLSAELAIQQMNGYQIGNSRIRLSWGRSQNEKNHSPLYPTFSTSLTQQPMNNDFYQDLLTPSQYHRQLFIDEEDDLFINSLLNTTPNTTTTTSTTNKSAADWRLKQIYAQ
jgi:RNA recognition motif-containing protein